MATRVLIDHRHPEKAHRPDNPIARKPDWIRVRAPNHPTYHETRDLMRANKLVTVCEEAACPNIGECWSQRHATMMIMGDTCTRACAFCNVRTGMPNALDADEPNRVADAVAKLGLRHVVITSVDRDDLADGGARHFARVIGAIRAAAAGTTIEVLTPDFLRKPGAVEIVAEAAPDVFKPQSGDGAAALPHDPAGGTVFPVATAARPSEDAELGDLHEIRPDGRTRGGTARSGTGDGRSPYC